MTDHRQAAVGKIGQLVALLKSHSQTGTTTPLVEECEGLAKAVAAFHFEGIRFRMFNVDRMITRAGGDVPSGARPLLDEIRRDLEAAGFHTRSHQAPTT